MRSPNWLLPVFIGLAGIAGCTVHITTSTSTTSATPTTATTSSATATATPTPALGGNGVAELAPAEVLARAKQASTGVTSVRIRGRFHDKDELLSMDLRVQGTKASGWVAVDGQRLDLRRIESTLYFKPDDQYLEERGGKEVARQLSGKWLKTSANDKDLAELISFASVATMLAGLPDSGEAVYARKGTPTTINGIPAIPVSIGLDNYLYIATEGKPYLLRVTFNKGQEYLDFLEHGKPVTVEPPPAKLVADLGTVT